MTEDERKLIEQQIEQITCFLDACYAGVCHDLTIGWAIHDGTDAIGRESGKWLNDKDGSDYGSRWLKRKGMWTSVRLGKGDAYYGSSSLGRMLHNAAYEWREKLLMQLQDEDEKHAPATFLDLVDTVSS